MEVGGGQTHRLASAGVLVQAGTGGVALGSVGINMAETNIFMVCCFFRLRRRASTSSLHALPCVVYLHFLPAGL